jgi:hypothetical protein
LLEIAFFWLEFEFWIQFLQEGKGNETLLRGVVWLVAELTHVCPLRLQEVIPSLPKSLLQEIAQTRFTVVMIASQRKNLRRLGTHKNLLAIFTSDQPHILKVAQENVDVGLD